MTSPGLRACGRSISVTLVCSSMLSGFLIGLAVPPAAAALTSVRGSACTYWVNLGLFGGPQTLNGCGELVNGVPRPPGPWPTAPPPASQADHTDPSYAPHVALPADGSGSATAITAKDDSGAKAQYGPATANGGLWPPNVASATPSGPQFASTVGTPDGGTVNSFAEIRLRDPPYPQATCATGFSPPCYDPGGFGGPPVWGDSLRAECTATEAGVTGSATFSNSFFATATDAGGAPLPSATEPIPTNPAPNTTRSGVVTNVGDVFAVVFNEQIINADGSLTVNAVHVYLIGPTAVGELVRGQVTCGTAPSPLTPTDTVAPACGTPVVEFLAPDDPTPKTPRVERVGVFDAGGLQSITDIVSTNATVDVGNPDPAYPQYTKFTVGQTGPLPITATRIDEALPMYWSFEATDKAGNTTTCRGVPGIPPVAADDNYTTNEGVPLTVPAPGVLANDADAPGRILSLGSASDPPGGTLDLRADGSFTYTPDTEFSGDDTFTYALNNDLGGIDSGKVTITVVPKFKAAATATTTTTSPSTTTTTGVAGGAGAPGGASGVLGAGQTRVGTAAGDSDTLPRTGAEPLQSLRLAVLLILGGGVVIAGTKHRRLRRLHRVHR